MSKDSITVHQLIRIAEDTPWEAFEAMSDGRLLLRDRAQTMLKDEEPVNPLLWVFEMRVGLHFERHMQAIMSCGHFIRMRNWDGSYKNGSLSKLDPAKPDSCLYKPSNQISGPGTWRPWPDLDWSASKQAIQQAYQAQAQSIWGQQPLQKLAGLIGSNKI